MEQLQAFNRDTDLILHGSTAPLGVNVIGKFDRPGKRNTTETLKLYQSSSANTNPTVLVSPVSKLYHVNLASNANFIISTVISPLTPIYDKENNLIISNDPVTKVINNFFTESHIKERNIVEEYKPEVIYTTLFSDENLAKVGTQLFRYGSTDSETSKVISANLIKTENIISGNSVNAVTRVNDLKEMETMLEFKSNTNSILVTDSYEQTLEKELVHQKTSTGSSSWGELKLNEKFPVFSSATRVSGASDDTKIYISTTMESVVIPFTVYSTIGTPNSVLLVDVLGWLNSKIHTKAKSISKSQVVSLVSEIVDNMLSKENILLSTTALSATNEDRKVYMQANPKLTSTTLSHLTKWDIRNAQHKDGNVVYINNVLTKYPVRNDQDLIIKENLWINDLVPLNRFSNMTNSSKNISNIIVNDRNNYGSISQLKNAAYDIVNHKPTIDDPVVISTGYSSKSTMSNLNRDNMAKPEIESQKHHSSNTQNILTKYIAKEKEPHIMYAYSVKGDYYKKSNDSKEMNFNKMNSLFNRRAGIITRDGVFPIDRLNENYIHENINEISSNERIKFTEMLARFEKHSKQPRTVIVIKISEVYFQCARAVMRAGLWRDGDLSEGLPTVGQMLKELTDGRFDGESYDQTWLGRAKETMW